LILMTMICMNCESQKTTLSGMEIPFEDLQHYPYALTSEKFLVIDNQDKMDEVYKIIYQKNPGDRYPPIPTVNEDEIYVVLKPVLKDANDVQIKKVMLQNKELNVVVEPYNNPQESAEQRMSPNILLKLLKKTEINRVNIRY